MEIFAFVKQLMFECLIVHKTFSLINGREASSFWHEAFLLLMMNALHAGLRFLIMV